MEEEKVQSKWVQGKVWLKHVETHGALHTEQHRDVCLMCVYVTISLSLSLSLCVCVCYTDTNPYNPQNTEYIDYIALVSEKSCYVQSSDAQT